MIIFSTTHPDNKLTNDGPACRVCGCTENNACRMTVRAGKGGSLHSIACSWADREALSPKLCSACFGTEGDMAEAIERGCKFLRDSARNAGKAAEIGMAALSRRNKRKEDNAEA